MGKKKVIELDVDFIGGDGPLTEAESKLVSAYILEQKLSRQKVADEKKVAAAVAKLSKADC
ncbi:MAG: hypothetical protein IPP17_23555 [Bacteroidetes bacterium]|nr:hypothetical protein [Bacteroidota bacterium]